MKAKRHIDACNSYKTTCKPKHMPDQASLKQKPAADVGLQRELAALFVQALNLDLAPQDIDPEAPLYGEGLGLDSIDILEVALLLSKQYGIQMRADSRENQQIFRSLRDLAEYIAAQRTK
jgi:acyl carrier protein